MLTVPEEDQFADEILSPTEFVDVPFVICLKKKTYFNFFIDVLGVVSDGCC